MTLRKIPLILSLLLSVLFPAVSGAEAGSAIGLEKEVPRSAMALHAGEVDAMPASYRQDHPKQQAIPRRNWLTPGTAELIETDDTEDAYAPQVAVDPSGNAIAVWRQQDGARSSIWANRYMVGTGWGSATLLETNSAGDASYPQVAVDPTGNAVAVWEEDDLARSNIWANSYTAGTGWGSATLIETNNGGDAYAPQVAVDPTGNAVVVWEQFDGTRYNIWTNRYTAGTGWGIAGLIEADNGEAGSPQVAVDPTGNAVAVWKQSDGLRNNIWANRYTAGTGWGSAGLIETDNAGSAGAPQVAVDPTGNAVAVWEQYDGFRFNIWANTFSPGMGWGTAMLIETDDAGGSAFPQVAVDPSGNAAAVWGQDDGIRYNIWANSYTAGTGWGTAELIEINDGTAGSPQVAFDTWGYAVAVWYQDDGTSYNIWANSYAAGTGWDIAELIETDDGTAGSPQVAFDTSGNAISVWHQDDGLRSNIWANRLSIHDPPHATYSPGSGILTIPELHLGGAQLKARAVTKAFDIELTRLFEPGYVFKLTNYGKITATNNPMATYNPATKVLAIPTLEVLGKSGTFHATFKKRAGAYIFEMTAGGRN